jgi:NAD(P)-dependent dehydrogenase (short-subunit alcohol dehydrogenase family)
VVLTGASDGIGAAAARRLHRSGAQVVVVGRSAEKTAAVAAELDGALALTADFARLDDVRRLAAQLRERLPRIDVLANNAGASFGRRAVTVDGHEQTFQVDHLAPYLLTRLLEEPLRAVRGRVVVTASFVHWVGGVRRGHLAEAVGARGPYVATRAYARAKWCNVLFTRELARRWTPEVTAACFDPGAVATSFGRAAGGVTGVAFRTPLTAFMRTPAQGADTLVWLATAEGDPALRPRRRPRPGAVGPLRGAGGVACLTSAGGCGGRAEVVGYPGGHPGGERVLLAGPGAQQRPAEVGHLP